MVSISDRPVQKRNELLAVCQRHGHDDSLCCSPFPGGHTVSRMFLDCNGGQCLFSSSIVNYLIFLRCDCRTPPWTVSVVVVMMDGGASGKEKATDTQV